MRIIGIDPGSRTTGYGIIEKNGPRTIHIDNGCLTTRSANELPDRLVLIYQGLMEVFSRYHPDVVAIEEVFVAKNIMSSLRLGEARGVALLAAKQNNVVIYEYATREVKQALTGYGQASKDQIQKMVRAQLNLPEVAQEDASDALAVALCHLQSYKMRKIVA
jgi:crossover junction endodeoxyribonuclease RuvC